MYTDPPVLAWTDIRTLVAASADASGLPASTTFVKVLAGPLESSIPAKLEIYPSGITTTGTPTSVIVKIYRCLSKAVDAQREYLQTIVWSQTDIAAGEAAAVPIDFDGLFIAATVTFSGGAAPTVTAVIKARAVQR